MTPASCSQPRRNQESSPSLRVCSSNSRDPIGSRLFCFHEIDQRKGCIWEQTAAQHRNIFDYGHKHRSPPPAITAPKNQMTRAFTIFFIFIRFVCPTNRQSLITSVTDECNTHGNVAYSTQLHTLNTQGTKSWHNSKLSGRVFAMKNVAQPWSNTD